jgi:hypothetical protein
MVKESRGLEKQTIFQRGHDSTIKEPKNEASSKTY